MRRRVAYKIKVSTTKVKVTIEGHRFVTYESCVSHNSKIDKVNSINIHRKVKHKEKVYQARPGSMLYHRFVP